MCRLIGWLSKTLLAFSISYTAFATHQVGGHLEMRAIGTVPGRYRIIVTNYLESGPRADSQTGGALGIFRKRDNAQMMTFGVAETGQRQPIIYANEVCAEQRNLRFIVATFEAEIQLDPARYDDPLGYYISYQTRNRNGGIDNILNPLQTGFTFYLEFPALQQGGQLVLNSSPRFGTINGEYVCIGEPFTFPFGGTDPDDDELRYSMITPLDQTGTGRNMVLPGPYPNVTWVSGYGASNAIPGSPTLSVNPQTGQLSVTATELGLFVFAVKVEEFRSGIKIGEVRRDFQLLVIDCPPTTTPDPTIRLQARPVGITEATLCQGDSAVVLATVNPNWNYQWRRDGVNLANATHPTLTVGQSGEYTVVVSLKSTCSKTAYSKPIKINVVSLDGGLKTTGHLCATTGSVTIRAASDPGVTYQWYRDGRLMANQRLDSLVITQAGRYQAVMTHATLGCIYRSQPLTIARSPVVQASIQSATGFNRLCPQDSLAMEGKGGLQYIWQLDGQVIAGATSTTYRAKTVGSYIVTAIDADGCRGVSTPFVVVAIPPVTVSFDSIPGVCGPNAPVLTLKGSPPGGEFAGIGVAETEFSPERAGVGNHKLTYTVKAAPECAGTVASRMAIVAPIPTVDLPDTITTYKGNTFALTPGLTGAPIQFAWSPPHYLDDPAQGSPNVVNIQDDITYALTATNATGCKARDSVYIRIVERLWVPDAFTPNGDGLNDVWQLIGIEAFPNAIVTIFNRWGEVVFLSDVGYHNPFTGTMHGTDLPSGLYAYTLRTIPGKPPIRGSLMLLR
ncbi:gliding motility-associated C-terminal domain-containing protein [Spirosoma taeanense]|uniref:Gliding motility-associated C-terminal domain-containing protein n=1 Tax=Spirosoma taeanense TaxID=2735870 RepID=A0A6M5YF60_9BACT|nr:gliding motility-associated C-terminal domain-containing protein [Spirosoma taeanense]QJW91960.1 gliding motility-associated C-terminal domain-containing protein [Spirosoma taeanense]